jgi:GAF domain-containing protein
VDERSQRDGLVQRDRILRRDADLARLVEALLDQGSQQLADDVIALAMGRDAERRSIAQEALEGYRELNLLYNLAERSSSLDPATIIESATTETERMCRRGVGTVLLADENGRRLGPFEGVWPPTLRPLQSDGFVLGEGIVGAVAAGGDGEIVNDPTRDRRATQADIALGALMVAPLRAGGRTLGVLLVCGQAGMEFTAGEHRMLSAVAALTAPALSAALTHARSVATARVREAELERQLQELRSEVETERREQKVLEITNTEYFRWLRAQSDELRSAVKAGRPPADTETS